MCNVLYKEYCILFLATVWFCQVLMLKWCLQILKDSTTQHQPPTQLSIACSMVKQECALEIFSNEWCQDRKDGRKRLITTEGKCRGNYAVRGLYCLRCSEIQLQWHAHMVMIEIEMESDAERRLTRIWVELHHRAEDSWRQQLWKADLRRHNLCGMQLHIINFVSHVEVTTHESKDWGWG